jgi:hypothetical protein
MTSKEWMASRDPDELMEFLIRQGSRQEGRKFHLFACGCCRLCWHLLSDERFRSAVEVAERRVDGRAGDEEVREVGTRSFGVLAHFSHRGVRGKLAMAASRAAVYPDTTSGARSRLASSIRDSSRLQRRQVIAAAQCDLIRDLFGNPFERQAFDPAWLTPIVVELARAIYDHRDYEKMPFLGDALEDAGCANSRVLEHCRTGPVHARGCWVLDALTGREGT